MFPELAAGRVDARVDQFLHSSFRAARDLRDVAPRGLLESAKIGAVVLGEERRASGFGYALDHVSSVNDGVKMWMWHDPTSQKRDVGYPAGSGGVTGRSCWG